MQYFTLFRRLMADQRGASAVEFAIVAIPLFILLFAAMEFGLIYFTEMAIESAMTEEARTATIAATATGGCNDSRAQTIITDMQNKIKALPNSSMANVAASVVTAPGTSPTTAKDICLEHQNDPYPATCNGPYIENNGNNKYDPPSTSNCVGAAGDLVEIRVTYPWKIITPLLQPFFTNGYYVINSTIVLKNEPNV